MKTKPSPLFEPVLWEGDRFKILDETLLPWQVEYLPVTELSHALQAVKEMKTRAFGQVLTFFYAAALVAQSYRSDDPAPLRERLVRLAEEFSAVRPTFDFRGLGRFFPQWFEKIPRGTEVGGWIQGQVQETVRYMRQAREGRARRAAELLPNPCGLLTHCNISGELVAVAQQCQLMGKEISIFATETRPYLQGSRLTAWEVSQAGIPVTLIPDSAIAQILAGGEVNAVLVGSDRSAQNGDIINKVGTYPLALVAKEYGVPFYALVQETGGLAKGEDIEIEERPVAELLSFQGRSLFPEGADGLAGRYPAFDVTPAALITSLISFNGTCAPEELREKFRAAPSEVKEGKKSKEPYLLIYGIPKRSSYSYIAQGLKAEEVGNVLLPEMRPEIWGAHVVAKELLARKIPTTLISDNMMGTFFARGEIKRLYLFYTELGEKGPSGLCGSLLAVLLARAHGVPIELLESEGAPAAPGDRNVSTFLGQKVCPEGVRIHPLEKEVIPWSLFK